MLTKGEGNTNVMCVQKSKHKAKVMCVAGCRTPWKEQRCKQASQVSTEGLNPWLGLYTPEARIQERRAKDHLDEAKEVLNAIELLSDNLLRHRPWPSVL